MVEKNPREKLKLEGMTDKEIDTWDMGVMLTAISFLDLKVLVEVHKLSLEQALEEYFKPIRSKVEFKYNQLQSLQNEKGK